MDQRQNFPIIQNRLDTIVRVDIDSRRDANRFVPAEFIQSNELFHNLLILLWNSEWTMGVYRVELEMIREGPDEKLVENATLIDREIVHL